MRQGIFLSFATVLLWIGMIVAQENSAPRRATRIVFDGHIATVHLAQHFTTTIRLPEPVSSVVVGDPNLILAEHSPNEPLLVFVKPLSAAGETNILISTNNGRQFPLLLKSSAGSGKVTSEFDLLVVCRAAGTSFIEDSYPTSLIAETLALGAPISNHENGKPESTSTADPLPALLEKQRNRPLPKLQGDRLKVGIGPIEQRESQLIVLFSVVNSTAEVVELMAPQVQLAGQVKSGLLGKSSHWTTDKRRASQGFRLWPGQSVRGKSRKHDFIQLSDDGQHDGHECGRDSGHSGIHESGTGARKTGRQTRRHLGVRIVGIRAVIQHRVVGVAVGFLCGRVIPRTQINPQCASGAACFYKTRLPIDSMFDNLENNVSLDEWLDAFPEITRVQAQAVLELAKRTILASPIVHF